MKGLVIIPTYNEAENIPNIVPAVLRQDPDIHVLVVDDGSPDGTAAIVIRMAEKESRIHLLQREKKNGLGRAYIAGFKWALASSENFQYVFEMDADFSHDPNEIHLFLDALKAGYDAVCGSRYMKGGRVVNWDMKRLFLSQGGNIYARFATGVKMNDLTGGYNCYGRHVLETLDLDGITSNGYSFQIEMKAKTVYSGFRFHEVPIVFKDRELGTTKMSGGIINEAFFKVWDIRAFKKSLGKKQKAS
jgi:dolichol-phosphate mannosyltransferase